MTPILKEESRSVITLEQIKLIDSIKLNPNSSLEEKLNNFGVSLTYFDEHKGAVGYYSSEEKRIALKKTLDPYYFETVVSHELAHHIQFLTLKEFRFKYISDEIKLEQQCESIAYYHLIDKLFPDNDGFCFSYFNEDSFNFLINYYGNFVINDYEEFKKESFNYYKFLDKK